MGGGGHCKSVLQMVLRMNLPVAGIIDLPEKRNSQLLGVSVIGSDVDLAEYSRSDYDLIITMGSVKTNEKRKRIFETLNKMGYHFGTIISDRSSIGLGVSVGVGTVIFDHTFINVHTQIGKNCIVNTGALVEHDCRIEDHVHLCPGVRIAGEVRVEEGAFLGIGSTVIQGMRIGKESVVGAGAVVIDNVPDRCLVTGVPAKVTGKL